MFIRRIVCDAGEAAFGVQVSELSGLCFAAPLSAAVRAGEYGGDFTATVESGGAVYAVTGAPSVLLDGALRRCPADDYVTVADLSRTSPDPLEVYRDPELYMTLYKFGKITEGAAATHTFRSCLRDVMRRYPVARGAKDEAFKRALRAALFWDEFNSLRNFNHEGKPMIITAPAGFTVPATLPIPVDRQIIIIK